MTAHLTPRVREIVEILDKHRAAVAQQLTPSTDRPEWSAARWVGAARMARARQAAGSPLSKLDLEALERDGQPGPASLRDHALAYARAGYRVGPVTRDKVPLTKHGVSDATTDLDQVDAWWTRRPGANILGQVPDGVFVIDVDPRKEGALKRMAAFEKEHGPIVTRRCWSGRDDGGYHLFFRHPGGELKMPKELRQAGLDLKKGPGPRRPVRPARRRPTFR
jgi:hypothetical protein